MAIISKTDETSGHFSGEQCSLFSAGFYRDWLFPNIGTAFGILALQAFLENVLCDEKSDAKIKAIERGALLDVI